MAKECLVCGKTIGAFTGKVAVSDGFVCTPCWLKAGRETSINGLMDSKTLDSTAIREMIAEKERTQALIDSFKPTHKVDMLAFDDNTQTFVITHSKKHQDIYRYDQIVGFELLEDGETITKGGLGRAVAGGLLFGGIGAIVGGVTGGKKSKNVCKSLQIKLTLRNSPKQTEYLPFIATETKTGSIIYKTAYKLAQDALSALQLATEKAAPAPAEAPAQALSGADEILKYKGLLDAGIITEEEFSAKKAQILGL